MQCYFLPDDMLIAISENKHNVRFQVSGFNLMEQMEETRKCKNTLCTFQCWNDKGLKHHSPSF